MEVTFETAALQDAVKKASRIAPAKGPAFDKYAGVLMEVKADPMEDHTVTIRATDGNIFYREWVEPVYIDGDKDTTWRIPAQLLAQLLATYPTKQGSQTVLADEPESNRITVACSNSRAVLALLKEQYFPQWDEFDATNLATVNGFAARLNQVSWAVDSKSIPICGVHINGKHMIATNRYRIARVECEVPVSDPITVPASILAPVMRQMHDVKLGVYNRQLYMMPDDATQIIATTYAEAFPPMKKAMNATYEQTIRVSAEDLRTVLSRMPLVDQANRLPRLDLTIGDERIYVQLVATTGDEIEDQLDIIGQACHDDQTFHFVPSNLIEALANTPNDDIEISYSLSNPSQPFYVRGGSGYEAWIAGRAKNPEGTGGH